MNQKSYEIKTLLNAVAATAAAAGTVVDMTPSASVGRRECKVIVGSQILTAGTFPISLAECDTTNGTFTALAGDSVTSPTSTGTAQTVSEYHVHVTKRYVRASIGTVAGTTATANLLVLIQNMKRIA